MTPLKLDVLDGELLMVETGDYSLADPDRLEMRTGRTTRGIPHFSPRLVRLYHSWFEFLVHVAGMVEQRLSVIFHDQGHTLPLSFPGTRRRLGDSCRIGGCTVVSWSLSVSCSRNMRIHPF